MITKELGRTGLEVTQLGYGSMGLRGPRTWGVRVVGEEAADRFLNRVLDAGINFIDTEPDYGISEERIGRYIGSRRGEYYLATKQGIVKFVGTSSSLPDLPGLVELGVFDTFQVPYSCLAPEHHDWITRAAKTGATWTVSAGS